MEITSVIAELRGEAERISRAIAALNGLGSPKAGRKRRSAAVTRATSKKRKRGAITPAGRRRLSMLMKKRWAERKKASAKKL
jgi:hypothetical protein